VELWTGKVWYGHCHLHPLSAPRTIGRVGLLYSCRSAQRIRGASCLPPIVRKTVRSKHRNIALQSLNDFGSSFSFQSPPPPRWAARQVRVSSLFDSGNIFSYHKFLLLMEYFDFVGLCFGKHCMFSCDYSAVTFLLDMLREVLFPICFEGLLHVF
jgi:hypothetical protein